MFEDYAAYEEVKPDDVWHNPTDKEVVLKLYVDHSKARERKNFRIYRIPAKGKASIPYEYRQAIQDIRDSSGKRFADDAEADEHGVIWGGMAPNLKREGCRATLHTSLDPLHAERKAAEAEALRQVEQARVMKSILDGMKESKAK